MLINYLSFENKIAALHLSVNCLDQPLLRLETFDFWICENGQYTDLKWPEEIGCCVLCINRMQTWYWLIPSMKFWNTAKGRQGSV